MNFKTFIILFLLLVLQSCSLHYEKRFGGDDEDTNEKESAQRVYEVGYCR